MAKGYNDLMLAWSEPNIAHVFAELKRKSVRVVLRSVFER